MLGLLKETFRNWKNDNAQLWCAALAYYTVFSLSPLLLIVISLVGLFFGKEAVQGELFGQLQGLLGKEGAAFIQEVVSESSKQSTNVLTTVVGFVTLALGAAGVFGQLKQGLNAIWRVKQSPKAGIGVLLRDRFLTFGMVVVIGFLLLVSLVVSGALSAVSTYGRDLLPFQGIFVEIINLLISFVVISLLFGLIFKTLPDIKLPWKYVWKGAVLTSFLFVIGKTLIGLYIGHNSTVSSYGAAGSLIVVLLWTYYAGQILFLGAEFTKVEYLSSGNTIIPSKFGTLSDEEKLKRERRTPVMINEKSFVQTTLGSFVSGLLQGFFGEKKRKR